MEKYRIIGRIGSGAYSTVLKAIQTATGTIVALKEIQIPPDQQLQNRIFGRQIKILQQLGGHPNIIKLIQAFSHHHLMYLVFEYIPMDLITFYKTLKQKEKRNLNDSQITYIFSQICCALQYIHSKRIIHRDIKPENILIDPTNLKVKIIDFGFSKSLNQRDIQTQYIVTRWYRPIEVVLGLPYDYKVDIFSIGALLLQLYTGRQVFRSSSNIDQLYWICFICGYPSWQPAIDRIKKLNLTIDSQSGPILKNLVKNIRPQAQNLIHLMLKITPQHRPSIFQILQHQYFKGDNNLTEKKPKQINLTQRTISQYQKRKSQNNKINNINLDSINVLEQRKPSNSTFVKEQKKIIHKKDKSQQNNAAISKKEKSLNTSANKVIKFGIPTIKETTKSNKKLQISSFVNSNQKTHRRSESNHGSIDLNQISGYSKKQKYNNYDPQNIKKKVANQNIALKKLHRMSYM